MTKNPPQEAIDFLYSLVPGESVEVLGAKNVVQGRGTVQETAPELGFVWIRTEMGERKLLDIQEHFVRRFQPPMSGCFPPS